jgi:hypothetical protein
MGKENKLKYLGIIPICLFIIGYFGVFWTLNLSNIDININMNNNTLEAIKSINYTALENVNKQNICNCSCIIEDGK